VHAQNRGSGSSGDGAICGLFLEDPAHLAQHAVTKRFADRQVTIGEVCLEPVSERLLTTGTPENMHSQETRPPTR
jgi:hypothetical protein